MKTLCGIAVMVLGLWGTAAAMIAELKPDGHTLLKACTAVLQEVEEPQRSPTTQEASYEGFCVGMTMGIVGLSNNLSLPPHYQHCLPSVDIARGAISGLQIIRVVLRYLHTHPARLPLQPAMLVLEALHDAFPCTPAPSRSPR
jgi:hypothetical protein